MIVNEAIAGRRSVRAFVDDPIAGELVREILVAAAAAPSGGNLQPWHVHALGGEPLAAFKRIMADRCAEGVTDEKEHQSYPDNLCSPYRERRYELGEQLYAELAIPRDDRPARLRQFARNFQFFGAPLAFFFFVDRRMGRIQWIDIGMFMQNIMLLLRERGFDSCPQGCWTQHAATVSRFLDVRKELMLVAGMAVGRADPHNPLNGLIAPRVDLSEFATLHGL